MLNPQSKQSQPFSWLRLALFAGFFLFCQSLWQAQQGSSLEQTYIHWLTVRPAAWLISFFTPDVSAIASGSRIIAPGGGINILNGCEGTDVLFLLWSAFLSAALPVRQGMIGLLLGTLLVWVLNQGRIVGLFYTYRMHPEWFGLFHGGLLPLLMVGGVLLYFIYWLRFSRVVRH